jgi:hypothetical protein
MTYAHMSKRVEGVDTLPFLQELIVLDQVLHLDLHVLHHLLLRYSMMNRNTLLCNATIKCGVPCARRAKLMYFSRSESKSA